MNFTQDEKYLIDFLEYDFFDEIDDYDSAEGILLQKTSNPTDVSEYLVKFIDEMLEKKKEKITKDAFKIYYKKKLEEAKEKALQDKREEKKEDIISKKKEVIPKNNLPLNPQGAAQVIPEKKSEKVPPPLKQIIISKDILCIVEYREILIEELRAFIKNFVNTFTGIEITTPYPNMQSYSLEEEVQVHDELGEWTYHSFQDCMRIHLKMSQGSLPQKFMIEKDFFEKNPNNLQFQAGYKDNALSENQDNNKMTLENFLRIVVNDNQKDPGYISTWLKSLRDQHVEKFEEILAWDDKDWDGAKFEVNSKKIIQRQLNKFKYKTNLKSKGTLAKSEIFSIAHRIKRFLIWKTNPKELENIAYLDERALQAGFEEIRKEYTGDYLLQQLQVFDESYAIPKSYSKSLVLSRGMLLYGPPGTGKTTLTDTLPNKVGFTPISYPLCAAEVNRSLVGQTEKLLMELVTRATKIPYLLCCVGIDEIDGLAPKRDEKSSQHKVDALAVLLSVIGGIKDVPNLIFLASTNRLNQMDEAFKRRMSGQFFVGRPSPAARQSMIKYSQGTGLDEKMVDQVVMMTANFSGAALKQFISYVVTEQRKLSKEDAQGKLSYEQLANIAARTSKQFSIRLGNYSLPELFILQKQKEKLLSIPFLKSLKDNKAIITFKENYLEVQYVRTRVISAVGPDSQEHELDTQRIISKVPIKEFFSLCEYISRTLQQEEEGNNNNMMQSMKRNKAAKLKEKVSKNSVEVCSVSLLDAHNLASKEEVISQIANQVAQFKKQANNNAEKIYVVIWNDIFEVTRTGDMSEMKQLDKLEIVHYIAKQFDDTRSPENLYNLFTTNDLTKQKFLSETEWSKLNPFNKKEIKFTGRILVDLNDEDQEMRFQLDEEGDDRYQLHNESLLLEKKATNSFEVLPKIVEFASERGIDFILLMDMDFLLSNNAFDESKIKESITEKMQEFNCYEKSLLIIDVDSLVGVTQSVSHSSMGPSTSYSLSDTKLYSMIIHYAKSLPKILNNSEYWVALISKNEELTRMIKKDLSWPKTMKELEKEEEEEKLQEEVKCVRCEDVYTEAKNELNSCCYHDGLLVEFSAPVHEWRRFTASEAKMQFIKKSQKGPDGQSKEPQFLYLCCLESVKSQGCRKHRHVSDEDNWEEEKGLKRDEHNKKFEDLKKLYRIVNNGV